MACLNCNSHSQYETEIYRPRGAGIGLPLGSFLKGVKLRVVVCTECGFTEFYVSERERKEVAASKKWKRVEQ